jgi:hypothetical protein
VPQLRQEWLEWVSGGRERYFGSAELEASYLKNWRQHKCDLEQHNISLEKYRAQVKALQDGIKRHTEFAQDEQWKKQHCRLCPRCRRPIQKTDGCDSMICGQNFHGGNTQPGCGAKFSWGDALPYQAELKEKTYSYQPTAEHPSAPMAPKREYGDIVRGTGAFHPFTPCSICGDKNGDGILGLRFRCIHCKSFSVCRFCEPMLAEHHSNEHVFEVMYEADFDWNRAKLPVGMPVHIVRNGGELPHSKSLSEVSEGTIGEVKEYIPWICGSIEHRRAVARGVEPCGFYRVRLVTGAGFTDAAISTRFVAPAGITSNKDVQQLLDGTFTV